MCVPHDAHPPIPAIAGAAIDTEDIELQAADGTKFAAFAARSDKPNGAGVVVLPDVRGLFTFYEELGMRFAEQGINAVTIDYFGRTAGIGKRNDPNWGFMEHVMKTHPNTVSQDTRAAVEYLRSPAGGNCTSVFTVGFCFGGSSYGTRLPPGTAWPARSAFTVTRAAWSNRWCHPKPARTSRRRCPRSMGSPARSWRCRLAPTR